MLSRDVERYVQLQRTVGFKFRTAGILLRSFAAFAEAHGDETVRSCRAADWAARAPSQHQRRNRLLTVRRFALAMQAEDPRHQVPAADALGRGRYQRRRPHIYADEDIARLMSAASRLRPAGSFRPLMYTTLIGLLAATGMRISEALSMRAKDVTDDGLLILQTKFRKSRMLPIHDTTRAALDSYLSVRLRRGDAAGALFPTEDGRTLPYSTVNRVFLLLARECGLRGRPGLPGPRMHDLRHTFAVRCLEKSPPDRDGITSQIVALSTYLGHTHATDTYWYLQATPILMEQIAEAGEAHHRVGRP